MDNFPLLDSELFIVGNIAPDCGVRSGEDYTFQPPKTVTHWSDTGEGTDIEEERFYSAYIDGAEPEKLPFYIGYYCHLLTDKCWSRDIGVLTKSRCAEDIARDRKAAWEAIKRDWYDLDHLFLKRNPGFAAFSRFAAARDFQNSYLSYYPAGAIEGQIDFISRFYSHTDHELERTYKYLTEAEMDAFTSRAVSEISEKIRAIPFISGRKNAAKP